MKKTMSREVDLGNEPVRHLLLVLAVPAITSQVVNALYNMVDRMYIGHIPEVGSAALTGVGVCFPIIMIISAFAYLMGMGGAPRASIYMGKKDNDTAEKILGNSFSALVIASIILTVTVLVFQEPLLYLFGASKNTISYAKSYMTIYAIGTIFVQLTLGMNAFISAQGFSTISMMTVIIGSVTNIILDPIFIFGFNMGVQGAAVATVLSQALSAVWALKFLCGKKTILRIKKKNLKIKASVFLPCAALGIAPFAMQATESVLVLCFNSSLLKYGGDIAVGAMTILTSVMQFAMMPLQGLGQGAQPVLSYNYGAKNADRVKKTFRLLVITCLTYSTLLWAAVQIIPKVFVSIFTADASLINFTAPMLRIYLGGLFLFGIQIACQMTFTSLGKAVNSIVVAVVRKFVLLLPLIYIMPHVVSNPTTGVYMAEPIADIIAVLFTSVLFSFQFKKALAEIQNENN